MHFDALDLTTVKDERVTLQRCRIDRLVVRASRVRTLELADCTIGSLEFYSDSSTATISASGSVQIDELSLRAPNGSVVNFVTNRLEVLTTLRQTAGVQGLDHRIAELQNVTASPLQGFAEEILLKLDARQRWTYVIEARSRTPGDGAERWMPVPTDSRWADLTDAFEASGLASVRSIEAQGPPKVRVSLTYPPAVIMEREALIDEITWFWGVVR